MQKTKTKDAKKNVKANVFLLSRVARLSFPTFSINNNPRIVY